MGSTNGRPGSAANNGAALPASRDDHGPFAPSALPGLQSPSLGTPASNNDVALLIDWENLKWSLANNYRVTPNISSLVEAARDCGRLVVARAYADWTMPRLVPDAPNLYRAGIEPVYVPGRHPVGSGSLKNSADVRLAVDAVELCVRLPHVGAYLLVTGDGDLIHALNFLRLNGRRGVVVGVGDTMNALLSAAADSVLLYERDIEPLAAPPSSPTGATPMTPGAPPIETVIGWVVEILRQSASGAPYPLTDLGQHLRRVHNFDARQWYGLRLKDLLVRGQEAAQIHLSTIGGVDHVSLPGALQPVPDALPDPSDEHAAGARVPAWASATAIGLDALSEDDARALLRALRELEQRSTYLVFKYVVDNLTRNSVLPQLARDQIDSLVQDLIHQGLLLRHPAIGVNPQGEQFTYSQLVLNTRNATVQDLLELSPTEATRADGDPACAELLAILKAHGAVSGLGHRFIAAAEAQAELERRVKPENLGYTGAAAVVRAAESAGLVRTLRQDDGTILIIAPDPSAPPLAAADEVQRRSIWYVLGDAGLQRVLRTIGEAEDQEGHGKGLTLMALVGRLQGLVGVGVVGTTGTTGDGGARPGRVSMRDQSTMGRANSLVTRHLPDAGLMSKVVTTESDQTAGLHRVERFPLNRAHPLVVRALAR